MSGIHALCAENQYAPGQILPEEIVACAGVGSFFYENEIDDALFERMYGKSFKQDCTLSREDLRYLRLLHRNACGEILIGEMVCNRKISALLLDIFKKLYDASYPIEKVLLIDNYDADDEKSMEDNNSSCFNFRKVPLSKSLSKHSYGLAVDINPFYNPYYKKFADGRVLLQPEGCDAYLDRSAEFDYKVADDDLCVSLFKAAGFEWGGDWTSCKDYQHFEITL